MSDRLKTSYGIFENDDFVEENGQLRELTVKITLAEYRELVASSVLQRDSTDRIEDLTQAVDFLCRMLLELSPDLAQAVREAVGCKAPPTVFEALLRASKDGDVDA